MMIIITRIIRALYSNEKIQIENIAVEIIATLRFVLRLISRIFSAWRYRDAAVHE